MEALVGLSLPEVSKIDHPNRNESYVLYIHSREIKALHFFNGKYMGNCLKYKTMGHRVFKKRLGIQQNIL